MHTFLLLGGLAVDAAGRLAHLDRVEARLGVEDEERSGLVLGLVKEALERTAQRARSSPRALHRSRPAQARRVLDTRERAACLVLGLESHSGLHLLFLC